MDLYQSIQSLSPIQLIGLIVAIAAFLAFIQYFFIGLGRRIFIGLGRRIEEPTSTVPHKTHASEDEVHKEVVDDLSTLQEFIERQTVPPPTPDLIRALHDELMLLREQNKPRLVRAWFGNFFWNTGSLVAGYLIGKFLH